MKPWEVLQSRYVLRRPWMKIREDHVRLPTGEELEEFHVIEFPDWACVVCTDEAGRVVMVEQFRHPIGRTSLEFPSGVLDDGETPLEAAQRELSEETGYESDDWTMLGACSPDPSKNTNQAFLFIARDARRTGCQRLDAGEDIRVRLERPADVLRLAEEGYIVHGIHLTALYRAVHRGLLPVSG